MLKQMSGIMLLKYLGVGQVNFEWNIICQMVRTPWRTKE